MWTFILETGRPRVSKDESFRATLSAHIEYIVDARDGQLYNQPLPGDPRR